MYKYSKIENSLEDTILSLNGLSQKDIDVSDFQIDLNQDCLLSFKEKLLKEKDKSFFIVGDYDFDGISSTTNMTLLFNEIGIKSNYYIPNRSNEGYGVNNDIIKKAYDYHFDCLLLLDNGIVANKEIEYAYSLGLKVFIIDHHEYEVLPKCEAIIHPNLLSKDYEDACTGGLTALFCRMFNENEYIDTLGGIASLADMVKVLGYNRYLIKRSLELLNNVGFPQINILSKRKKYTYDDLTFTVIPKVNAISRLDKNVNILPKYFMSNSKFCMEISDSIEQINNERKKLTNSYFEIAKKKDNDLRIIVSIDDEYKEGLCGLLAARLCDTYGKPALVLSRKDGILKGSGRSVGGFNIHKYLLEISDIFESFGGHEMALGLSLKEENLDKLIDYIKSHDFKIEDVSKDVLSIELKDIDIEKIESLKPFGQGFKEPLYSLKNPLIIDTKMVKGIYPKYLLSEKIEAIDFKGRDCRFNEMIFKINRDSFNHDKVSLMIEDLI